MPHWLVSFLTRYTRYQSFFTWVQKCSTRRRYCCFSWAMSAEFKEQGLSDWGLGYPSANCLGHEASKTARAHLRNSEQNTSREERGRGADQGYSQSQSPVLPEFLNTGVSRLDVKEGAEGLPEPSRSSERKSDAWSRQRRTLAVSRRYSTEASLGAGPPRLPDR